MKCPASNLSLFEQFYDVQESKDEVLCFGINLLAD